MLRCKGRDHKRLKPRGSEYRCHFPRFRTFSDSPYARARLNGNLRKSRSTTASNRRWPAYRTARATKTEAAPQPHDTVFPRVRRFGCSSSCCRELWNLGLLILLRCPESNKLPQLFDLIWLSGTECSGHGESTSACTMLAKLKETGMSARRMAAELTARGIPTPNGAKWHGQTVRRMINRVGC